MLTENTITRSQILELRNEAIRAGLSMVLIGHSGHWMSGVALAELCNDAIEELMDACARYPMPSCAQCAEILNIRAQEPK